MVENQEGPEVFVRVKVAQPCSSPSAHRHLTSHCQVVLAKWLSNYLCHFISSRPGIPTRPTPDSAGWLQGGDTELRVWRENYWRLETGDER